VPEGRELVTLRDAGEYIQSLPKAKLRSSATRSRPVSYMRLSSITPASFGFFDVKEMFLEMREHLSIGSR
jgi:hypothetical protein